MTEGENMLERLARGSKWTYRNGVEGTVTILGVVDGWVVTRRKGAQPFLIHSNEWLNRFAPALRTASQPNEEGEGK